MRTFGQPMMPTKPVSRRPQSAAARLPSVNAKSAMQAAIDGETGPPMTGVTTYPYARYQTPYMNDFRALIANTVTHPFMATTAFNAASCPHDVLRGAPPARPGAPCSPHSLLCWTDAREGTPRGHSTRGAARRKLHHAPRLRSPRALDGPHRVPSQNGRAGSAFDEGKIARDAIWKTEYKRQYIEKSYVAAVRAHANGLRSEEMMFVG